MQPFKLVSVEDEKASSLRRWTFTKNRSATASFLEVHHRHNRFGGKKLKPTRFSANFGRPFP